MKHRRSTVAFVILTLTGIMLFCAAVADFSLAQTSQACNSTPNCPYGWSVQKTYCQWVCNCGEQQMPYTCYREEGVCNANGNPVAFQRCYQGNCCCPSGNCAGQTPVVAEAVAGMREMVAYRIGTVSQGKTVVAGRANNTLLSVVLNPSDVTMSAGSR